ncbi:MAG TPA: ClpXP protease specificity-enhancing factor [Rhodocyclaceae bacterium]|nr:ClpXP protease specificity-enhancing factor [Rhodocyclaceae bacterium]
MTTDSTKPYLIRAIYDWCIDQGFTPHIAVIVDEHVVVPQGYAQDGQIVLNLGPEATNNMAMGNDAITFQARFGGKAHSLLIPVANVLAVYARENGQGMAFEPQLSEPAVSPEASSGEGQDPGDAVADEGGDRSPGDEAASDTPSRRSHLTIIK